MIPEERKIISSSSSVSASERKMQILLERIQQLPRDVYNYVRLDIISIDDFTDKAFQLTYSRHTERSRSMSADFEAIWIPAWTLKKDNNNNVWMLKKFYDYKAAEVTRMQAAGKHWWEMKR